MYYEGLSPTQSRSMKREFAEEYQIVTTKLLEYSDIERQFNEYELGCLSKPLVSYYLTIIYNFFTNYIVFSRWSARRGKR